MKKAILFSLVAVSAALASCSDSNSDEPAINAAEAVAGVYDGYTVASSQYFGNMVAVDQKVTVVAVSADRASVSCNSDTWGAITIADAAVVATEGGAYAISGTGVSVMGMQGQNSKEYTCNMSGTVDASGNAEFSFSCPQVMGGLTIRFAQGAVPAEIVVPGTYKGYTEASSAYFQGMTAPGQTIAITAAADGKYDVAYTSDTWGEFSVKGAAVTADGNMFRLSGEGVATMGMGGNVSEYACTFEGTVDAAKEEPYFKFAVAAVMGGLTVEFHSGDMPGEAE